MLARMKDTRNYFAIKCLRKDKIVNDEDVEDTLIERKILTLGTNHPYLCHLFCTFQSPVSHNRNVCAPRGSTFLFESFI